MDPITHLTTGGLGGRVLRGFFPGRAITLLTVTAALIPDIDNFIGIGNPELYLIHHRGITHSLTGGLGIALALAGLLRLFSRSIPFWKGVLVAYAGILVHIFLDLITSYGTQVFAPFTDSRHTVQCVFILDPILTVPLLALWIGSFVSRRRGRVLAVTGLCWVLVYPGINFAIRTVLENHLGSRLRAEGVAYDRLELSPEVLTPFFWKLILEDPSSYQMTGISLLEPERPLELERFQKADRALLSDLGERASYFRTFAWFAAYPVMQAEADGDRKRLIFGDLRFYSTSASVRRTLGQSASPFSLTALLDRGGRLIAYEYGRFGGTRLIHRVE